MSIRDEVRAVPAYRFQAQPHRVKLDQNENPLDLPDDVRAEALAALEAAAWNRYPELNADSLRADLARVFDWPVDGIAAAGGSNVLIQTLVIAAGIGRTVLTPAPTFGVYAQQAGLLGARLVEVPLGDGFGLPVDALLARMREGSGVVFVANPAAPTGNLHPADEIEALLDAAGDDWLVVIDEAYGEVAGSDHRELVRGRPNAVSLRTLSKAYGLAGARVGYALAEPAVAEQLRKCVLPFSVSALQVAVARTALARRERLEPGIELLRSERDRMLEALTAMEGVEPFPSVANFVLARVGDAAAVYGGLLERGVLVRRQDGLRGLQGCLRLSVGTPAENDALLAALPAALERASRDATLGGGRDAGGRDAGVIEAGGGRG